MQTLTVQVTNENALKVLQNLQEKNFIKIISQPDFNSLVFPGEPLSTEEFRDFILSREDGVSMNLTEAKTKWAKKKKQLLKLAK